MSQAITVAHGPELSWFADGKFGIFIHWGIYSVGQYAESWSFYNHGADGQDPRDTLSHADYMAQRHAFLARRYDPDAWASLFHEAGARYAVMTTKHHDGVALWDTAEGLSVVRDTPAGRDLVGPFAKSMRGAGLRLGLYYSHLDWNHPDYPSVHRDGDGGATRRQQRWPGWKYSYPPGEQDDAMRWANFLRFHRLQLAELCQRYDPDLLWFDGDWERSPDQWRFAELAPQLRAWRPGVVLNSRLGGHGDYATPEQGLPTIPPVGPWEFCMTMNRSWSMATDPSYKTADELARTLVECVGMGGNLLLNIAPLSDGTIFYHQSDLLRAMGRWIAGHAEAIYDTTAGLPHGHHYGPSTLSKDRRTLYLFLLDGLPRGGEVAVKGIRNAIRSATLLGGDGSDLPRRVSGGASWAGIPGTLWIRVGQNDVAQQPGIRVVRLELDGPLDLYVGHGKAITQN